MTIDFFPMTIDHYFRYRPLSYDECLLHLRRKADRSIAEAKALEESPGNAGHPVLEMRDVREGMVTEKKITAPSNWGKGEKVG